MQKGCKNMNRIFKVIWSKTKNCYVVASELAKGTSKSTSTGRMAKRAVLAAVAALLISPLGAEYSYAAIGSATVSNTPVITGASEDAQKLTNTVNAIAVQDGAIVKADKTIGENVTNLDAALAKETADRIGADKAQDKVIQTVNDNLVQSVTTINKNVADGFTALNQADAKEAAAREAKDNELNERITNEANGIHAEIKDGDEKLDTRITNLDTRITNVKEYLENQTSENYVSKTDAAVQDGAIVKAAKTIGENVTNLDAALAKETAARIGADKSQDKVIQQVNENAAAGIKTLTEAYNNEVAARQAADTTLQTNIDNEAAARKAADGKLVDAVNSGLSLSNDNVLQKNTTAIDDQGKVTTSKTDANEMILNKGNDNQITLNDKGIKVGLNSTVQDAKGFYAGGDTAEAAKAALNADGSIKGADGKFTVDAGGKVTAASGKIGNVDITSAGAVSGVTDLTASGKVTAGTLTDGKAAISNGNIKTNGGFIQTGGGNINTQGGALRTNGGNINAGSGTITGNKLTDGVASLQNGNLTTTGNINAHDIVATGDISGKAITGTSLNTQGGAISGGQITGTGLDVGAGTIKTTGAVETGTLETTGNATISGNLTVDKDLTVNGTFDAKTLSSTVDANNYTTINGGKTQSVNLKLDVVTGGTKASASTFDENGSNTWAKDDESIGKSTVTADSISQKLSDLGDNPQAYAERAMSQSTDNKYSMVDTVKDGKKTNVTSQSATESSDVVTDANGNTSTFRQRVDAILQEINNADGDTLTKVEQTDTAITSQIGDGSAIKSVMNADGIANTANGKSITNDAANIINTGTNSVTNQVGSNKVVVNTTGVKSAYGDNTYTTWNAEGITNSTDGNMTNTVGGEMKTTVAGKVTEDYKSDLDTKVGGNETHYVAGSQSNTVEGTLTETVTGDVTEDYKANLSTTVGKNLTTTVTGDSSLKAENITNEAKNKITNKAIDVETDATSSIVQKVTNDAGSNTSTQLSYQTKEEMSQADGKTAFYLRGAAEEKSQLIDGSKKTTIDTIAGQTNTNITDGTNTSNDLQKADQIASSVTDGTNTTVVNQNAGSLASSITDGTKVNNTNNTVDKSEQLIKASDTQYSATSKTGTKMEDALVSGDSVIDVIKNLDDAANPFIGSTVTDGTNSTGVTQTAKDITNTAKNGTIANEAKDIINNATENMTNTVGKDLTTTVGGEMKTTVTGKTTENYNGGLETTITGEEKHTVNGDQTNTITGKQATTVTGDSSLSAKNITNTASEKITNQIGDGSAVKSEMTADGITNTAEGGTIYNKSKDILNEASGDILNFADGEIGNSATKITNLTGDNTVTSDTNGTTFENKAHSTAVKEGTVTKTTISGNTITTGEAVMDYADVLKDLGVRGNAAVDGNTTLGKEGAETTLTVNSTSTFNKDVTMKENATVAKDLSVGGNASVSGSVTASSYKVGDKTYISESGINANDQKVVNVAPGRIAADSKDAINGSQLYQTNERVTSVENRVGTVENRVDKLDSRVDKVGANAAALANLHPLEFDADSKWNIAAAVGGYKGETATAIGAFYRPNENVMVNVSSSFGTGENMYGGGISLRIGQGGNKARRNATNGLTEREKAMQKQIDSLTGRLDALLSVINPNMSKDFPDVPENHWAYEAVSRLAGNDVIQGYEDGKYHGDRTMTRYEMAEIIYNALSKGAKAEKKLVEEFKPELQAMAAQKKA